MSNAEIISIGTELLLGQIVDTNATWLAQRLTGIGVNVFYKTIVGDNPKRMKEVIQGALKRSDVVITGGGLGPTQDDLTREIISESISRKLVRDPMLMQQIEQRFRRRGLIMTSNNERQAFIPEGAIPVLNPNGTAPSFIVECPQGIIFALPGVPFELKWLFENEVVPYLQRKLQLSEVIIYKILKVAEVGESRVDDLIGHLIAKSSNPTVGVLAHPGQVDVRIAAKAANNKEAVRLIAPVEAEVRNLLGRHIFATDDETIEDAIGKLLLDEAVSVALYEDLTGGLTAERLQLASNQHFVEGTISNSLTSIRHLLAISRRPEETEMLLNNPEALTNELAWVVRSKAKSDLGLAIHTVPDPHDHSKNLAEGLTFVSATDGTNFKTRKYNYGGRGLPDRTRMSLNAIELLRSVLLDGMQ